MNRFSLPVISRYYARRRERNARTRPGVDAELE
jgi:hypothetical protein